MPKIIEYVFEDQDGVVVQAEFIDEAPKAARVLWDMLAGPITSAVQHGKWAGPEVFVIIPEPPENIEGEFIIATPIPGDILYVEVPPSPVRGFTGFHEFAMFYGREGKALMLQAGILYGHRPNLVATIRDKENLKKFAAACENVWKGGEQRITVRRSAESD
jgi:hypothetical protein